MVAAAAASAAALADSAAAAAEVAAAGRVGRIDERMHMTITRRTAVALTLALASLPLAGCSYNRFVG